MMLLQAIANELRQHGVPHTVVGMKATRHFAPREINSREDAKQALKDLGLKAGLARISPTGVIEKYRGPVDLGDFGFTKMPLRFIEVTGYFSVVANNLTDLDGCPEVVGDSFIANRNELVSLRGGPKTVGKDFDVGDNHLKTLEHGPVKVGRNYFASRNPGVPFERPSGVRGVFHGGSITGVQK